MQQVGLFCLALAVLSVCGWCLISLQIYEVVLSGHVQLCGNVWLWRKSFPFVSSFSLPFVVVGFFPPSLPNLPCYYPTSPLCLLGYEFFGLSSGDCGSPRGLEPADQFRLSPHDLLESFDCLLQLDTLLLEVVHQGTPATVQWALNSPLHTTSFSCATRLSRSFPCSHLQQMLPLLPSGIGGKLRHSLQPETWTAACWYVRCLGHHNSNFWIETMVSPLPDCEVMAVSLNSESCLSDLSCLFLFVPVCYTPWRHLHLLGMLLAMLPCLISSQGLIELTALSSGALTSVKTQFASDNLVKCSVFPKDEWF